MFHRQIVGAVGACVLSLPVCDLALGQIPGRGSSGGVSQRLGVGETVTPRSGLGVSNNPVVNPVPSLTPGQVLNPRGSLNTGQVLNPAPSLRRPRTAVFTPDVNGGPGTANIGSVGTSDASLLTQATTSRENRQPIGARLLESVVALDEKIAEVAAETSWPDRLSLDMLRSVPVSSEEPSDDARRRQLNEVLMTYRAIASDEENVAITALPEFKRTTALIEEYLTPTDKRRLRELRLTFSELHDQLRKYKNGDAWSKYLSLPERFESASGPQDGAIAAQMTKLLSRFDKLAGNKTYQKVTNLPGFHPAHSALKVVVAEKSVATSVR